MYFLNGKWLPDINRRIFLNSLASTKRVGDSIKTKALLNFFTLQNVLVVFFLLPLLYQELFEDFYGHPFSRIKQAHLSLLKTFEFRLAAWHYKAICWTHPPPQSWQNTTLLSPFSQSVTINRHSGSLLSVKCFVKYRIKWALLQQIRIFDHKTGRSKVVQYTR